MNRKEYLKALEEALAFLPKETRWKALDFYGEMIYDRMEDGMDEASAVAAMDAPEEIAARLRTEHPGEGPVDAENSGETARPFNFTDDAMSFSTLVNQALQTASQAMESVPEKMNGGMEEARRGMEQAAREMKEGLKAAKREIKEAARQMEQARQAEEAPFREDGSDGEYTWKTFTCGVDQVRSVALYAVEMPIRITPCEGDTLTLRYCTSAREPYTVTLEDGALTLHPPERGRSRLWSWDWLGGMLRMAWNGSTPTIHLEMPADAFLDLLAHTSNGSIKAGGFTSLCQVELKTSNSRIELERTVCKALDMRTSNARLVLREVESKRQARCVTSNGRIEATGVRAGEGLSLRTGNSGVHVQNVATQGALDIHTSNGRIAVEEVQAAGITLKTSNSGISGVLPGAQRDWAIDSGTSNGSNSLPTAQPGGRPLSVHTSNGSISLRFQQG